jgi:D-alanyl-D-alanine carboxypeptidase/D-alanyl-D-alanine-endopeptidase (penicillin-binding protein 4)
MYTKLFCVWYLSLAAFCAAGQQAGPTNAIKAPATLAELRERLAAIVKQPRYEAALWGIKIVSADTGKTLFEHDAQKLFSPASNSKLYTVALALQRLGTDYRIRTSLYSDARPDEAGTLKGDLVLYGRGDPTINARLNGGNFFKALAPLVAAVTNAGVKQITGGIVGDETYYRGPGYGSGWVWEDLENYYGAEISALTINDNYIQATVKPGDQPGAPCKLSLSPPTSYLTLSNQTQTIEKGGRRRIHFYRPLGENVLYVLGQMPMEEPAFTDDVTMHDPAAFFAACFKEALEKAGVSVAGRARSVNWLNTPSHPATCSNLVELGFVESLPMSDMAREVAKPSQNLYTDLLLAQVGEQARAADTRPDETSEDLGIRELAKFLTEAGVKRGDTLFEEGSGLGRDNLTTPDATVTLLQYMSRQKSAKAYYDSLPIAGVDGTLRNRMKGTPAAGNLRAKTGTLRWGISLSGYVTTAAGEKLVFSLMLNRYHAADPRASGRADLDVIGTMLAGFTGRSTE